MAYSSLEFYRDYKAKLVQERGAVGTSSATKTPLPFLYPHDLLAMSALLVPFLIVQLRSLSHVSNYGHGADWTFTVTKEQGSVSIPTAGYGGQITAPFDPASVRLERKNMPALFARSISDWLRKANATATPLVRRVSGVGGVPVNYHFWPRADWAKGTATNLMGKWDALMAAVERVSSKPPAPGRAHYSLEQTEYFFAAYYAACAPLEITFSIDTGFVAEVEEKAREVAKEGAEIVKDAADEVGEIAADVADTAGEALGNFGSGFLRGIGLAGAALVIGLWFAKKKGLI